MGWRPSTDVADPVIWRPRAYNTIADYLCNYTMNVRRSWRKVWPTVPGLSHGRHNVLVFSDGGARAGDCSASAWVMGCILGNEGTCSYHIIAAEGQYFADPIDSFRAETIALDMAVSNISCYIR